MTPILPRTSENVLARCLAYVLVTMAAILVGGADPVGAETDGEPEYTDSADRFVKLSTAEGLASNRAFDITQDEDGLLWVGTFAGLSRYDGVNVTNFEHDPLRADSLGDNSVLAVEADGRYIWTGTGSGKIGRLDRITERFVNFDLALGPVVSMVRSRHHLWVGTVETLVRVDPADGTFERFPADGPIQDLAVDSDDILWAATTDGLIRYDITNQVTRTFAATDEDGSVLTNDITAVDIAEDGTVWFGADRHGVHAIHPDGRTESFRQFEGEDFEYFVLALEVDVNGDIWTTSGERLYRIDPDTGNVARYAPYPSDPGAIGPGAVTAIFEDRDGDIWVAKQDAGVARLDPYPNLATLLRVPASDPEAQLKNRIHTMSAVTVNDREMIVATTRSSPVVFDIERLTAADLPSEDLGECSVVTSEPSASKIWCIADSIKTFDLETQQIDVLIAEGLETTLQDAARTAISDGRDGVWVAGRAGVFHFDDNGRLLEEYTAAELGLADGASTLALGGDRLVVGHWGLGLAVVDLPTDSIVTIDDDGGPEGEPPLSDPTILDIEIAPDGSVLAATNAGLDVYSADLQSIRRYNPANTAMPSGGLSGLVVASDGRVWVSSPFGMTTIDLDSSQTASYTSEDGLISGSFGADAFTLTVRGVAVAGGTNGLNTFDPLHATQDACERPATLQSVESDGEQISRLASVDLDADTHYVALQFRQMCFANGDLAQLRYRLRGESGWLYNERGSMDILLPSLGAGSHRVQVQAADRAGGWLDTVSEVTITLTPPWYQDTTVQLVAVGMLMLIGVGAALRRGQVARRRQRELEAEVSAQTEHLRTQSNQLVRAVEEQQDLLDIVAHDIRAPVLRQMINLGMVGNRPIVVDPLVLQREVEVMDGMLRRLIRSREHEIDRQMSLEAVDLTLVVTACVDRSAERAKGKGLTIEVSSMTTCLAAADVGSIDEVVENAIDNAIKYSYPGDSIDVSVFAPDHTTVAFTVVDTGVGIDPSEMSRLFTRFGRASQRPTGDEESVGLGLFAVSRLMRQMRGNVTMSSDGIGKGAKLTCVFPRWEDQAMGRSPNDAMVDAN